MIFFWGARDSQLDSVRAIGSNFLTPLFVGPNFRDQQKFLSGVERTFIKRGGGI